MLPYLRFLRRKKFFFPHEFHIMRKLWLYAYMVRVSSAIEDDKVSGIPNAGSGQEGERMLENVFNEHIGVIESLRDGFAAEKVENAGFLINSTLSKGNKLLLCGNGGSAADCQHIAAEMVVRFERERQALPAIALTTDSSILTAHANDYEFKTVFSRQVEAIGVRGDCLIAISTSGNSENVLEAVKHAKLGELSTIGLTGNGGGRLADAVDIPVVIPSNVTARIQEAHILVAHWWCQVVDNYGVQGR